MAEKPKHAIGVYRGSIRISLNGDKRSSLRSKLKKYAFEPNGFVNDPGAHGTGLWVNANCSVSEMRCCMRTLWETSEKHKGTGKVDHVWSNFELIDLRSLINSLKDENKMTDELRSFLNEVGLGEQK